jgi:hypothetical protein
MVVVVIKLTYTAATTSLLGEVMSVVRKLLPELLAPEVQPGRAAMLLERVGWYYRFHAASMPQGAGPV